MAKRHLIFDFDGVLGDTYAMNWEIVRLLHPEVAEEKYRIDHHLGNALESPVVPFTAESAEAYYVHYNNRLSVQHLSNALPALRRLCTQFRFHVVTSNCEVAVERVLKEAGVLQYFGLILGREVHTSKVRKFKVLARVENFALPEALFVTDTLGDLKEAEQVCLPSIAVTFGYHPRELFTTSNCISVIDTWEELEAHLACA